MFVLLIFFFGWMDCRGRSLQMKRDLSDSSVGFYVDFEPDVKDLGSMLFPGVPCCFTSAFLFRESGDSPSARTCLVSFSHFPHSQAFLFNVNTSLFLVLTLSVSFSLYLSLLLSTTLSLSFHDFRKSPSQPVPLPTTTLTRFFFRASKPPPAARSRG